MQRLEDNIEKHGRRLIKANRNNTDNKRINWTEVELVNKYRKKSNSIDVLTK